MDKFLDIMSKWDFGGQICFLMFVVFFLCVVVVQGLKLFVCLFRGWPKCEKENDDDNKKRENDKN